MDSLVERTYTRKGRTPTFKEGEVVYNLGCGKHTYENIIGVDLLPGDNVDIVHDLNEFPWPIESNSADALLMFHVLEHLGSIPKVMEEMYRILKPGGRVLIEVPYFRHVGAFQDPTHIHFFTSETIKYFCEPAEERPGPLYANVRFVQKGFWYGWPAKSNNFLMQTFKNFIQEYHHFYDHQLSKIVPSKIIVFEIEALK